MVLTFSKDSTQHLCEPCTKEMASWIRSSYATKVCEAPVPTKNPVIQVAEGRI
jgi:hypothetical protein